MKPTLVLILIVLSIYPCYSQEIIEPNQVILTRDCVMDVIENEFLNYAPYFTSLGINDLSIQEECFCFHLSAFHTHLTGETMHHIMTLTIQLVDDSNYSVLKKDTSQLGPPYSGSLIREASFVVIDDMKFELEDSFIYGDSVHDVEWDVGYDDQKQITCAELSHNKKWIGGVTSYHHNNIMSGGYYPDYHWYNINIWDSIDGKLLFEGVSPHIELFYGRHTPNKYYFYFAPAIKSYFTSDSRYYIAVLHDKVYDDRSRRNDPKISGDDNGTFWVSGTVAHFFDIQTLTFLPANRDVEFTSDEKYYVTERDGLPSLVDAETHYVLLRYDPGSTMTACGFSPDDARLYIACEDLKVYEFSSHVPDTAVVDWAVFE